MKLATAEQMRKLDAMAINKYGIPGIVIMENAGRGTVQAMTGRFGSPKGRLVSIFVGPGNNGGDGLVIARHLHQLGARPQIFLLVDPVQLRGDPAVNLKIVSRLPIPVRTILNNDDLAPTEQLYKDSWAVVDSIFGTGLQRQAAGHFAAVIHSINKLSCPVVAVDIPSGLNADSGQAPGACVKADLTVTFGLAKPGLFVEPGLSLAGVLRIIDIGIPPEAVAEAKIETETISGSALLGAEVGQWLPARHDTAHKGTYGHLLIIAGSTGKTGAAILCAQGAYRCGTGLATICVPANLNPIYETALPEVMTIPMPSPTDGFLSIADYPAIELAMAGKQALVVGPGLGTTDATACLIKKLYCRCPLPMVVDADGLNVLALDPEIIKNPPAARILTPHPGEMSRLTGKTSAEVQSDRIEIARSFARDNRVIMVLKGAGTVISGPDHETVVNTTGNPGMAAGGMGDVLAGVIGGFLAQRLSPWQAACLGVHAHGLAGDRLAAVGLRLGYLASELAAELPAALNELNDMGD